MHNKPYVYKCTHILTKNFYYGFRCGNKLPASQDLGIVYFTSSNIVKPNFSEYSYEIIKEFECRHEAYDYEQNLIRSFWGNPKLLNRNIGGKTFADNRGKIVVKDANGTTFSVSAEDERYMSGELVHHTKGTHLTEKHKQNISNAQKGKVTVRDSTGKGMRVNIEDAINYTPINLGRTHTKETRKLQSKSAKEACKSRINNICRIDNKKEMTLANYMKWITGSYNNAGPKILCSRLSDRKVISVNHLHREPTPRVCRLSDRKEMDLINFKRYTS